jgi:hypothetical protein
MLDELPSNLISKVGYRIAYGEAARLAGMATFDHGRGRDFAAGVGGEADAIKREVLSQTDRRGDSRRRPPQRPIRT